MPTPALPEFVRVQRRDAVERHLRQGRAPVGTYSKLGSAMESAARDLRVSSGSMNNWLRREESLRDAGESHFVPNWDLWLDHIKPTPRFPDQEVIKTGYGPQQSANFRVRVVPKITERKRPKRVFYFTDCHDNPELPKDRFRWMGRYIAETQPDVIVCGGDFLSLDSVSRHQGWGNLDGRDRSPFVEDIDSATAALDHFMGPIDAVQGYRPKFYITFGNHEHRAWLWENERPELEGMLWAPVEAIFADREWVTVPYREYLFIDGVGFTHMPHNGMGKPYGGKAPENQIGNDSTFSVVYGHTHKRVAKTFPKLGPSNEIQVFNPGCSLPQGFVEPYARMSTTGWSWGVAELVILDGRILGHSIIPMLLLEEMYA